MTVCLVGTNWGNFLGRQLRAVFPGRLLVCGRDPTRTQRIARKLDADGFLIGWESATTHPDVSAIILALPTELHVPATRSALNAGKHVFVEKPLAPDLTGADALIEVARLANRVLFVGEHIVYRAAISSARSYLSKIGPPYQALMSTAHRHIRTSSNSQILIDSTIHYVRAVRFLLGEPDLLYATATDGGSSTATSLDNISLILSSAAGWSATLWQTQRTSAGHLPELILTGAEGALKIWPGSPTIYFYPNRPTARTQMIAKLCPWYLREFFRCFETQRIRIPAPSQDHMGYQTELREFLHRITNATYTLDSAISARRDIEIVTAAHSSLHSGLPVNCSVASPL